MVNNGGILWINSPINAGNPRGIEGNTRNLFVKVFMDSI